MTIKSSYFLVKSAFLYFRLSLGIEKIFFRALHIDLKGGDFRIYKTNCVIWTRDW